ncbi:ABC transporter substrate-binding protein [Alkaliphilus peptidifermentans]|uniref:Iron complex transport system substrate-binding protein n=1 Tax=Alkaliphilus peptidifermentans DSM 18978 TaxID=1120976 RepID=A0A1G5ARU7_9FIRM|nr:ABC transporter substrate-binding protein [Alkaliphilus peptidifermentans]SCX80597.1 iron complex transport system substrate-binding protein [Alkaliphilus peptidifermentans DSM 18978]
MKKFLILFLMLILCLSLMVGCKQEIQEADIGKAVGTESDESLKLVDYWDREVTFNEKPQRVIVLYTSFLELWSLAGGSDQIVGIVETREKIPQGLEDLPSVGSFNSPNIEQLLALQPDLVVLKSNLGGHVDLVPVLEKNNIEYFALEYDNLNDYLNILDVFTHLTDNRHLYDELGLGVKTRVEEIIAKVPNSEPTVLLLFGSSNNISVRLPNSTVGSMLEDLGAINIAYDAQLSDEEMQTFSMELVLKRDPDFILVQTMGDVDKVKERFASDVQSNPAWGSLRAVQEGNFIYLPKDLYLYKANNQYPDAYGGLAKILYPQYFN